MTEQQFQSIAASALLQTINDRADEIERLTAENEALRNQITVRYGAAHAFLDQIEASVKWYREILAKPALGGDTDGK